jgi:uncharacterized SAM-binding protein YcdF (DUF218 family)
MNDFPWMFYLSKIVWFLAQPLNFSILLLAVAVIFGGFGWRRISRPAALLALLVLALSSLTSLGALIMNPLEERFQRPSPPPENVAGIVVLGGGLEGAINLARGGYDINNGGDRFIEAVALARRYPDAKIVISGGTGTVLLEGEGDADTAVRLFEALGVPRSRLTLEPNSRNTYENVANIRTLVSPGRDETWLLVTSAFHMPRSIGLFRKAGFPVVPWPVDYRTSGREGIGILRDNAIDALSTTTMAIREWSGLIAYKFAGRIDSVFPGPADQSGIVGQDGAPGGGEELPANQDVEQDDGGAGEDKRVYEPPKVAE